MTFLLKDNTNDEPLAVFPSYRAVISDLAVRYREGDRRDLIADLADGKLEVIDRSCGVLAVNPAEDLIVMLRGWSGFRFRAGI